MSENGLNLEKERELLFQELITTDPIISKFQPDKVVKAYKQLLRIAPELCLHKESVRTYLTQALGAQSLNPTQVEQLVRRTRELLVSRGGSKNNATKSESRPDHQTNSPQSKTQIRKGADGPMRKIDLDL